MSNIPDTYRNIFLESNGTICPFCGSESDVEGSELELDEDTGLVLRDMNCYACNMSWTNEYIISEISKGGQV